MPLTSPNQFTLKRRTRIPVSDFDTCHETLLTIYLIVLAEIEEAVRKMADGQDPISIYEARVQVVQSELVKKAGELGKLEHTLQTEYVPKVSKDAVDESLMEAKVCMVLVIADSPF